MKILTRTLAIFLLTSAIGFNANAATLSLTPSAVTVAPGAVFSLDLVISGLGSASAPSLGVFELTIAFDPGDLAFVGYTLGAELGVLPGEAIDFSLGEIAAGVLNIAEVSFLAPGVLDSAQPDTFSLATISFMAFGLASGDSTAIDIATVLALGDSLGEPLSVDSLGGSVVTAAVVPLPPALWLMVCAIVAFGGLRLKQSSAL